MLFHLYLILWVPFVEYLSLVITPHAYFYVTTSFLSMFVTSSFWSMFVHRPECVVSTACWFSERYHHTHTAAVITHRAEYVVPFCMLVLWVSGSSNYRLLIKGAYSNTDFKVHTYLPVVEVQPLRTSTLGILLWISDKCTPRRDYDIVTRCRPTRSHYRFPWIGMLVLWQGIKLAIYQGSTRKCCGRTDCRPV